MLNLYYVSFEFPPLISGGTFRSFRFTKHLPSFGIRPIVFCLDVETVDNEYRVDSDFQMDLPSECIIVPVSLHGKRRNLSDSYYFKLYDEISKNWEMSLFNQFKITGQKYKPDILLVTVPPFSLAKLALKIKDFLGVPLILDMRDAWSQWVTAPYASILHYKLLLLLERKCLAAADSVIVTSSHTRNDLLSLHPGIENGKISVITNCFESYIEPIKIEDNKVRIGYTGSFYFNPLSHKLIFNKWWKKRPYQWLQYVPRKENWLYRTPYFFFTALHHLFIERPDLRQKIEIQFAGIAPAWLKEMISDFELNDIVTLMGPMGHKQSLEFQQTCDILLLTSSKVLGGEDYSIAGKTFEYFSLQKPILAFLTPGAQKELLKHYNSAIICDPDNVSESVLQMKNLIESKHNTLMANENFTDAFLCKKVIKSLVQTIMRLTN